MRSEELTRFYFDTMALNDQLMQWYRAIFLAFESIIVIIAVGMIGIHEPRSSYLLGIVIIGLVVSFLGIWLCKQRGNIVDRQKKQIRKRIKGTDLEDCFKIYESEAEKNVPRPIFNGFLHVLLAGLLIGILWGWGGIIWWGLAITAGIYSICAVLAWTYLSRLGVPKD